MSEITFKALWDDYRRNSNFKYCFYHDKTDCSGKIKKAHSVQKEKILSQLEAPINGNNLIYSLNEFEDEKFRIKKLIPIGKSKASIFTGFCDYHDSKLFSPIENFSIIGTEEQLFLLAYRAFAHGFHQLIETLRYYESEGDLIKYFPKEYLLGHVELIKYRIEKFYNYKLLLDKQIEAKDFSRMKHHLRIISPFVPLACSSLLSPFYTFRNTFLNPKEEYSYLILNIIPDKTQTFVCISLFEEDVKGRIFFDEFETLDENEFEKAISSLLIYCTTNTFFSPLLWDKFTNEEKQQLYAEMDFSIHYGDQIKSFFLSKINFFKPYLNSGDGLP